MNPYLQEVYNKGKFLWNSTDSGTAIANCLFPSLQNLARLYGLDKMGMSETTLGGYRSLLKQRDTNNLSAEQVAKVAHLEFMLT